MQLSLLPTHIVTSVLLVLLSTATQTHAGNYFYGINAANSAGNSANYRCRTQAEWNNVATEAKTNGFSSIRILGFDCNALDMAASAAANAGITLLAGIFFGGSVADSTTQVNNEVQMFREAYGKYGAGRFKGLTIGNESPDAPGQIAAKVAEIRGYLRSVGVDTAVSTVHTWVAIRDHPQEFCIGDFVGANAHAFFDQNVVGDQAGSFVFNTVIPSLKAACPGKPIIITETGWPSRGNPMGRAAANSGEQYAAMQNLNCAAKNDQSVTVYAFEVDDQTWKANDNERSFGLFGKVAFDGGVNNAC